MATTELRPLGFGELLDRTFSYYRGHFWLFVGIMIIPQLLVLGVAPLLLGSVLTLPRGVAGGIVIAIGLAGAVVVIVLGYTAAYGATTLAVSEVHLGRTITIRRAYRQVFGQIGRLIKLELAILVRMLAWIITVILSPVAILLLFWYSLSVPALLLENVTASFALKRSRFLTKGQLDRVFVIWLLTAIVSWVASLTIQAPFLVAAALTASRGSQAAVWLAVLSRIAGATAETFTAPLLMIALVLLYYDVRVRKEAFDLQLMMASLNPAVPLAHPAEAVPPATS